MSTLQELFTQLDSSVHPIARAIHKGHDFKVLAIGFKATMVLKDHKAHVASKLTVLNGTVIYREGEKKIRLGQYEEYEIPMEIVHSVEALEDSLCLLTQG